MTTTIKNIQTIDDITKITEESKNYPIFIFKHSTICPVSFYAQKEWEDFQKNNSLVKSYCILVRENRKVSQYFAKTLQVPHESPQAILLYNKKSIWNISHNEITHKSIHNSIKDLQITKHL